MLCVHKHVGVDSESCEQLGGGLDMTQYVEEVLRSLLSADGPQAAVVGQGNESDSIPFTSVRLVVEEVAGVVPIVHSRSCVIAGLLCRCEGSVTESMVPDHGLLSSARLCAFPIALPLFSVNSLFRPNEANISYLYLLVYISLYNTLVLASWSQFSSFLSLSLSSRLLSQDSQGL